MAYITNPDVCQECERRQFVYIPTPYATLEAGTDGWNLRHHNMVEIQDLFGTDLLPTPFLLVMSADDVLARLRKSMDVPVFYIPTPEELETL